MSKIITSEDFLILAQAKHGERFDYSQTCYTGMKNKIDITCKIHGTFEQTAQKHIQGQGCPKCSGKGLSTSDFITLAQAKHGDRFDYSKTLYQNPTSKITFNCPLHGEQSMTARRHLIFGCDDCVKQKRKTKRALSFQQQLIDRFNEIHNNAYDYSKVDYQDLQTNVTIICKQHGTFEQRPDNHLVGKGCHKCSSGPSKAEQSLVQWLQSLNIVVESRNRQVIKPMELDIFLPELNIAIEFNGLYWHSSKHKNKMYHYDKTLACERQNVRLVQIFEDEWRDNKMIVQSRLLSMFGLIQQKLYARKCQIKTVNVAEERQFLRQNHIQGYVASHIAYGLYYDNNLVSIMTFSKLRHSTGQKSKLHNYELLRFCSIINTCVIGSANKLLSHFVSNFQCEQIISYSDRRWSQGHLYSTLGFTFEHHTKPNYSYLIDNCRKSRVMFQKHKLVQQGFDNNLTEEEIMKTRGYFRIYDCGMTKWSISYSNVV